jgi:hypothetical protein
MSLPTWCISLQYLNVLYNAWISLDLDYFGKRNKALGSSIWLDGLMSANQKDQGGLGVTDWEVLSFALEL